MSGQNQLAKRRASSKCVTSPEVAATIAVLVSSPMPGTSAARRAGRAQRRTSAAAHSRAAMRASE